MYLVRRIFFFFFFNDTATTEIYTLSLHDALPISADKKAGDDQKETTCRHLCAQEDGTGTASMGHQAGEPEGRRQPKDQRSEEHTSELQSPCNLVCRLLLEKKKENNRTAITHITSN